MKKNKFQLKKEETYKQLIEKGYFVLVKKGFAKTNISDIAEAAGYTRGAFYFHFDSKEDFFIQLFETQINSSGDWADLPYQFNLETTPLEELLKHSMLSLWKDVYEEPMSGWLLVCVDFFQSTMEDPSIKRKLKELHKNWENDVVKYIKALQEQGYVPSSVDPEKTAFQFISITYGFMIQFLHVR